MIRKIVIGSLFALAILTGVYVRFSHPDLTETQLFIDFWYVWLCMVLFVIIAATMLRKYE